MPEPMTAEMAGSAEVSDVVTSPSDLDFEFDGDLGSEAPDAPEIGIEDGGEEIVEQPGAEQPQGEQAAGEQVGEDVIGPPEGAEAEEESAAEQKTEGDDLPDGVSLSEDKKTYTLNRTRYEKFHGAYRVLRDAEAVLGEPITKEVIERGHRADQYARSLMLDFLSSEPGAAQRFIQNWMGIAGNALQQGQIKHDPVVGMAQELVGQLRQMNPRGYSQIAEIANQDLIQSLYRAAQAKNDDNVLKSVQYIDHMLTGKFIPKEQLAALSQTEPIDLRERRIAEREQALAQTDQQRMRSEWEGWQQQTEQFSQQVLDKTISDALAAERKAWEKFPKHFAGIESNVKRQVEEAMAKDANLRSAIDSEYRTARTFNNPQTRQQVANAILARRVNAAQRVIESVKPAIMREAQQLLARSSKDKVDRAKASARQVQPGTGGAPVPKSVIPLEGGDYDEATHGNFMSDLDALFR